MENDSEYKTYTHTKSVYDALLHGKSKKSTDETDNHVIW